MTSGGCSWWPARAGWRVPQRSAPKRRSGRERGWCIWPFPKDEAAKALEGAKRVVVVEGNATGQFERLLFAQTGMKADARVRRYDGLPFISDCILRGLAEAGHGR